MESELSALTREILKTFYQFMESRDVNDYNKLLNLFDTYTELMRISDEIEDKKNLEFMKENGL